LIEALGQTGQLKLESLEQKINYSAVLIRRGRADEARRFLEPVYQQNRGNFVVLAQFATAHFLTDNPDFEAHSLVYMKRALEKWPKAWTDVPKEHQDFLQALGWDEVDFDRYRRCEEHLQRLMTHRLNEKKLLKKKQEVDEAVDPIFLNAKNEPIRFRGENGEYQAGKIASADKESLAADFVDDVQQLLLWLPNDPRLLWLLAEAYNASAMLRQNPKDKDWAIHNANKVFLRLRNLETPAKYGQKEIRAHHEVVQAYADAHPLNVIPPPVEDPNDVKMTSAQWYRTLAVTGFVGLAVGMFALWQIQEVRRRRQARSAPPA
jgi:hypothetical protein